MITTPFTRPVNICIMILVIALHGLTAWAVVSMNIPQRPEIERFEPKPIQVELVTLATSSEEESPAEEILAKNTPVEKTLIKPEPKEKTVEAIEKVEPASEPIEPIKPKAKKEPSKLKESQPKPKQETNTSASKQTLIIEETKKITRQTIENETDLDAMIRAITKQYNLSQARQRQAAKEQAATAQAARAQENGRRADQDRLQAQATQRAAEQARLDKEADAIDELVSLLAEPGSWLNEHEPNTSLPLQVWRNANARSGDVFIVLLELNVNKDGYITEVQLLQSSGNSLIDAVAMVQVRAGQLNPLQQEGLPVDGMVPMSLSYEMP